MIDADGHTVFIKNETTGMVTTVDTKSGAVEHDPLPGNPSPIDEGIRGAIAPNYVPEAASSYFPFLSGWKPSPVRTHAGLDGVAEAPEAATFRRHFDAWRSSLVSPETTEHAALRIFKMFPGYGGREDLYPFVEDPAPIEPIAHSPDPPFQGANPVHQPIESPKGRR